MTGEELPDVLGSGESRYVKSQVLKVRDKSAKSRINTSSET